MFNMLAVSVDAEASSNHLGVCRLCGSTLVPSLRLYPSTFTVIGLRRGGFSVHFPLAMKSPPFAHFKGW